jgi:hypothetical protein
MFLSGHSLHSGVKLPSGDRTRLLAQLRTIAAAHFRPGAPPAPAPAGAPLSIPLTTVSLQGNFDAYVSVQFGSGAAAVTDSLLVDSGNAVLIAPNWEDIQPLPGYTVLGQATEPWGCPANVVQGPVQLAIEGGGTYTIANCVFYACTGANAQGQRTANFGTGRLTPWSASSWNTPPGGRVAIQSPLSYDPAYPCASFTYLPASRMFSTSPTAQVAAGSAMTLFSGQPAGYTVMKITPNLAWMAVIPQALTVDGTATDWPGQGANPIAMVDTGGGPVFLSDPHGYVYDKTWAGATACPAWSSTSVNCTCVAAPIGITLGDGTTSYTYAIDPAALPPSVQGLTGVLCQQNAFMMGQNGMNIGGISALFNDILIDYAAALVGFRPKQPTDGAST